MLHAIFAAGLPALAVTAGLVVVGLSGLAITRASVENEIYEHRLRELTASYAGLRDQYNSAVKQTAVTELVVEEGALSVAIRDGLGERVVIDTPYDPAREIYVDFAIVGGRVWIRRVFDEQTPPSAGTIIDNRYAEVDWESAGAEVGKAVYRSLSEGRWVIGVSGNGGLSLRRALPEERIELQEAPRIASFEEIEAEATDAADRVSLRDVIDRLIN